MKTLKVTSLFCAIFGAIFLAINLIMSTGVYFPYVFLTAGGIAVTLLMLIPTKNFTANLSICYLMVITVFIYALILSCDQNNKSIPATSLIVFLAMFPLTVDDRPIRMNTIVIAFAALYLFISASFKDPSIFRYDIMNTVTFTVVGILFYTVICVRNVHEIYQNNRVQKLQNDVISSLAMVIEERDESTGEHILRTEGYIKQLSDAMKGVKEYSDIKADYYENILHAAPLHDIGKIKIPDSILNKPGRLTAEEFELIKKHSEYGADIINRTLDTAERDYFDIAYNIALYHHERYDGTGYPKGLSGNDIPLEARMMALADVYDALVSERVYKKALSADESIRIIESGRGTQFDPALTDLFIKTLRSEAKTDGGAGK